MLNLRIESKENKAIYRIVEVNPDLSLFDLNTIISTVFMIENEDDAIFESVRLQGKKNNQIISVYGESMIFDSLEEMVSDWFIELDDEMHYKCEDGIQLKLTLLSITEKTGQPTLLKGEGHLYSKDKMVDIASLNEALELERALEDSLFKYLETGDFLEEPAYDVLFELADELKKLKPWQYFNNEDILAIQVDGLKYFVSVMGAGGQEYGMMIYDELDGYQSLEKILTDDVDLDDISYELSALTVNFVDRGELSEEDYELIKDLGLSFRGKKNWIAFRSYEPGMLPAQPDDEETLIIIAIIQAMIELTHMCKNGWVYPNVASNQFPLFDVDDDPLQLLGIIEVIPVEEKSIVIEINDIEVAKIKKKKKDEMQIEFDLFYVPFPISEFGERPIFPLLNLIVDHRTGMLLSEETITVPKDDSMQQHLFWEMLKQLPVLPSKIFVTEDMYTVLEPLAKLVGMELVSSKLSHMNEIKNMFMMD